MYLILVHVVQVVYINLNVFLLGTRCTKPSLPSRILLLSKTAGVVMFRTLRRDGWEIDIIESVLFKSIWKWSQDGQNTRPDLQPQVGIMLKNNAGTPIQGEAPSGVFSMTHHCVAIARTTQCRNRHHADVFKLRCVLEDVLGCLQCTIKTSIQVQSMGSLRCANEHPQIIPGTYSTVCRTRES